MIFVGKYTVQVLVTNQQKPDASRTMDHMEHILYGQSGLPQKPEALPRSIRSMVEQPTGGMMSDSLRNLCQISKINNTYSIKVINALFY